jgi:hypothetical protein
MLCFVLFTKLANNTEFHAHRWSLNQEPMHFHPIATLEDAGPWPRPRVLVELLHPTRYSNHYRAHQGACPMHSTRHVINSPSRSALYQVMHVDVFHVGVNISASISAMDIDGCFEPSQVVCLSLNAKDDRHDRVLPVMLGLLRS